MARHRVNTDATRAAGDDEVVHAPGSELGQPGDEVQARAAAFDGHRRAKVSAQAADEGVATLAVAAAMPRQGVQRG